MAALDEGQGPTHSAQTPTLEQEFQPAAVFCITLAALPHKWEKAQQRLGAEFPSMQAFPAVDMRKSSWSELPVDIATKFRRSLNKVRKHHYEFGATGAVGCTFSHEALWKLMVKNNIPDAVVFEDDAVVLPQKRRVLSKIAPMLREHRDQWDLVLLGGRLTDPGPSVIEGPLKDDLFKVNGPFYGTQAYWISNRGARFLLDKTERPLTAQLDSWIGMVAHLHPDEFRVLFPRAQALISPNTDFVVGSTTQSAVNDCRLCDVESTVPEEKRHSKQRILLLVSLVFFSTMAGVAIALMLAGRRKCPTMVCPRQ